MWGVLGLLSLVVSILLITDAGMEICSSYLHKSACWLNVFHSPPVMCTRMIKASKDLVYHCLCMLSSAVEHMQSRACETDVDDGICV